MADDGLLDSTDQVVPQVPAVGDLDGVRGTGADAVGVGASPVPADDYDFGTAPQPRCDRVRGAVGQQVDGGAGGHVDDDGAVDVALTEGEVVDAQDGDLFEGPVGNRPHGSQHGVAADGDAEPVRESGTGAPGHRQSDCRDHRSRCGGASAPRQCQSRKLFGECLCGAVDGAAEESADPDVDQDRIAADFGIGELPAIPGMHSTCFAGATRAHRLLIPWPSLDADSRAHPPDVENIDTVQMREEVHPAVFSAPGRSSTIDDSAGQRHAQRLHGKCDRSTSRWPLTQPHGYGGSSCPS